MNISSPRKTWIGNKWLSLCILACLLISPVILQGCDGLTGPGESESTLNSDIATVSSSNKNKLRHPGLLSAATRTMPGMAGKDGANEAHLLLAFNLYEADGITPRVLNRYDVTKRILNEYGLTRRVLSKYGLTKRVLEQYGITRRILNQYGITKRVLERYGLTPRILSKYNDLVTMELLAEYGIDEATLADEGLSVADIDGFNKLSALLNEYGITIEEFMLELEAALPTIRVKVYIDGAHLGISLSLDSEILDTFLEEISDDSDILFAEPDVAFDTSDLGTLGDGWHSTQITPWGITNIATPIPSLDELWTEDYILENPVHVYILDSGASEKGGKWSDLQYYEKQDFTMLFKNPDQLTWDEDNAPDMSNFDPDYMGNPYDESGHGSHIAGTIGATNNDLGVVGVAPSVVLHSLKVLTAEGRTDITTLLAAVNYVTRAKRANPERPMVVNMSLGVDIGTTSYNILDEAIQASINEGVIYVAAAGNDSKDVATYSPAHVDEVITVGAYNEANIYASFSNYGPKVDILAPGENIISLSHFIEETKAFEAILASGTSYAAPHVTGAVARYLGANPTANAGDVTKALKAAAVPAIEMVPGSTTNHALNLKMLLGSSEQLDFIPDEEPVEGVVKEKKK